MQRARSPAATRALRTQTSLGAPEEVRLQVLKCAEEAGHLKKTGAVSRKSVPVHWFVIPMSRTPRDIGHPSSWIGPRLNCAEFWDEGVGRIIVESTRLMHSSKLPSLSLAAQREHRYQQHDVHCLKSCQRPCISEFRAQRVLDRIHRRRNQNS